eukprot:s2066_g4.t1
MALDVAAERALAAACVHVRLGHGHVGGELLVRQVVGRSPPKEAELADDFPKSDLLPFVEGSRATEARGLLGALLEWVQTNMGTTVAVDSQGGQLNARGGRPRCPALPSYWQLRGNMTGLEVPSSAERASPSAETSGGPSEPLDYPSVREQLDEHDREEEEEALFRAEEEYCRRTGRRRLLSPAEGRRREPSGLRSEDRQTGGDRQMDEIIAKLKEVEKQSPGGSLPDAVKLDHDLQGKEVLRIEGELYVFAAKADDFLSHPGVQEAFELLIAGGARIDTRNVEVSLSIPQRIVEAEWQKKAKGNILCKYTIHVMSKTASAADGDAVIAKLSEVDEVQAKKKLQQIFKDGTGAWDRAGGDSGEHDDEAIQALREAGGDPGNHSSAVLCLPFHREHEKKRLHELCRSPQQRAEAQVLCTSHIEPFSDPDIARLRGWRKHLMLQSKTCPPYGAEPCPSVGPPCSTAHNHFGQQLWLLGLGAQDLFVRDAQRALDVLTELPFVDASRIGVVGCSGGGALSAYLGAIDPRVTAVAVACYFSTLGRELEIGTCNYDAEQILWKMASYGIDKPDLLRARAPKPTAVILTSHDCFPILGGREGFEEVEKAFRARGDPSGLCASEAPGYHQTASLELSGVPVHCWAAFGLSWPLSEMGRWLLALGAVLSSEALSPCDDEAGRVCPMSIGKDIGECLLDPSKHQLTDIDGNPRELEPGEKPLELSTSCKETCFAVQHVGDFVEVNKACDSEIDQFCQGMYYHGDTMTCLTQWTSQSELSSGCVAALPKKGSGDDDEVDAEKAAWRAKKKAARQAAMDAIEKEPGDAGGQYSTGSGFQEKGGDDKKKKKSKKKKAKKEL